ncbi:MAG: hypothetical protein KBS64_03400 [Treponema sp.]|nr:hypothetical protein [Candidatus Treponema equi]
MKKLIYLFAAVALLFTATACSDGSSDDDAPGSDSSIIVGTWEGDLYVADLPSFIVPKLTFTFNADGTYTHTLNPSSSHDDPASIGPGKWTFANNVVTMTPDKYPKEVMTPRYDPAAKTLSWTVEDSGDTSTTMTKKIF